MWLFSRLQTVLGELMTPTIPFEIQVYHRPTSDLSMWAIIFSHRKISTTLNYIFRV